MNQFKNKKLTPNAQTLRQNMTRQERHLWYDFLKNLPVTFHRQKVINNYIVDFYCAKYSLVIELDGSQHYEDNGIKKDCIRDDYLKSLGLTVLRYSNLDIDKNFHCVCEDILSHMPSPKG
ncbi:MAG: endonuclease domain-containing protein [Clostridia bacterium]|nr:endonuclease domain-containing protein [Clostridia bacterium]